MQDPQSPIRNSRSSGYVVGVDLGGTKILAAVVDDNGRVLSRSKRKTLAHKRSKAGPGKVADRIARTVREAIKEAGLSDSDIAAVGSSVPGPVDASTGFVMRVPNLQGWDQGYALGEELSRRLQKPVAVDNDGNLGALGEAAYGAGRGVSDLLAIFVGTGIGAGVILDGKLRHGFRWAAGEIGHMTIHLGGPLCGCGLAGHVEAIASRGAVSRRLEQALQDGESAILAGILAGRADRRITSGVIRKALKAGDPVTRRVLADAQEVLGLLIASVVNLLDPECIVMGGGLIEGLDEDFLDAIRQVAYANFLQRHDAEQVRILPAALGDDAVVLGAAVLARRQAGGA